MNLGVQLVSAAHSRFVFSRRVRVLAGHLRELLPAEATSLLDVGCGDGSLCRLVTEGRRIAVAGLEVQERPETAIPVQLFDGATIPRDDRSVDVVMIVDVLHHTDDPRILLREAARVARQTVLLKDHYADPWLGHARLRFIDWVGNVGHGVRLPYNYWTRAQWAAGFADAGLCESRRVEKLGLYPSFARPLFETGLHFVARLQPAASARS